MGFLSGLPHRGDAGAAMGDLDEGIGGVTLYYFLQLHVNLRLPQC